MGDTDEGGCTVGCALEKKTHTTLYTHTQLFFSSLYTRALNRQPFCSFIMAPLQSPDQVFSDFQDGNSLGKTTLELNNREERVLFLGGVVCGWGG